MSWKNSKSVFLSKARLLSIVAGSMLVVGVAVGYHTYQQARENLLGGSITQIPTISVSVGQYRFSLVGYTSPMAKVLLEGQGMYEETTADKYGKFTFSTIFSPLTQREACLTAFDTDGRTSAPLCLPPFPVNKHVTMGPILLPPTLTLNQDVYVREDTAIGTGRTAPNSSVIVQLASGDSLHATNIPIRISHDGSFSLSLPSFKVQAYEVSAHARKDTLASTKSAPIEFKVQPYWKLLLLYQAHFIRILIPLLVPIIIVTTAGILLYLATTDSSRKNRYTRQ